MLGLQWRNLDTGAVWHLDAVGWQHASRHERSRSASSGAATSDAKSGLGLHNAIPGSPPDAGQRTAATRCDASTATRFRRAGASTRPRGNARRSTPTG